MLSDRGREFEYTETDDVGSRLYLRTVRHGVVPQYNLGQQAIACANLYILN